MAHAQLMIILHVCTLWYEGHWRNILPTYWGLPHFADCLGQGLCLRSQGVFPGLALATFTSPGLHAGCKETDALSLRTARRNHQGSCCHCLPYGMKEPEFNSWTFGGNCTLPTLRRRPQQ